MPFPPCPGTKLAKLLATGSDLRLAGKATVLLIKAPPCKINQYRWITDLVLHTLGLLMVKRMFWHNQKFHHPNYYISFTYVQPDCVAHRRRINGGEMNLKNEEEEKKHQLNISNQHFGLRKTILNGTVHMQAILLLMPLIQKPDSVASWKPQKMLNESTLV